MEHLTRLNGMVSRSGVSAARCHGAAVQSAMLNLATTRLQIGPDGTEIWRVCDA